MNNITIFFRLCAMSFKLLVIYRVSFFISLALMGFWAFAYVSLIMVIFLHTERLAGLEKGHVLLVMAFYYLLQNIADIFYKDSFEEFGERVRRGLLDIDLIKPVPTRLLAFFREMRFDHLAGFIVTIALFIFALSNIDEPVSIYAFALGMCFTFLMATLYWSILSIISTFVFWISKNDAFRALIWNASQISRYPRQIYGNLMRKILTFALPFAILASVPADIALQMSDELVWYAAFLAAVFYLASKVFWEFGLKRYSSAS